MWLFNKHIFLTILVIALGVFMIVPALIKEGMFMDGQQYACVAMNMAHGKGSFWFPFLSETWSMADSNNFMEHPPLFYYLESFAFKVFGDSIYTERIFSLLMAVFNCVLIVRIWKLVADRELKPFSWMALFFFFTIPIVAWVFQNNMIEETLSVFTLLAVYFILRGLLSNPYSYLFYVSGGVFVFLATLTKGLPGLFPLVVPGIYFLVFKKKSFWQTFLISTTIAVIPVLIYYCLFKFNPSAKESLSFYVQNRLLNRIQNAPSTDYRLFTLVGLLQELIPGIIAVVVFILANKFRDKLKFHHSDSFKWALLFFLIGLSGTLPLMLTMVQNKFYFFAALPFFALAFAFYVSPIVKPLIERIKEKTVSFMILRSLALSLLFFSIIFSAMQVDKYRYDETEIEDAKNVGALLEGTKIIGSNWGVYMNWNFHFYLLRYTNISLDYKYGGHDFCLVFKNDKEFPGEPYVQTNFTFANYKLYQLKK